MSNHKYTGINVFGGIVTIGYTGGDDDNEAFVRVADIAAVETDWAPKGETDFERLTIRTVHGLVYTVTLTENDAGQACADAISDLVRAMAPIEISHVDG